MPARSSLHDSWILPFMLPCFLSVYLGASLWHARQQLATANENLARHEIALAHCKSNVKMSTKSATFMRNKNDPNQSNCTKLYQKQPQKLVHLLQHLLTREALPLGGVPGSFRGVNIVPHTPEVQKRVWARGKLSNSLSRQLQHEFMYSIVDKYGPLLPKPTHCLDWDGMYGGGIFATICNTFDVVQYAQPFGKLSARQHQKKYKNRSDKQQPSTMVKASRNNALWDISLKHAKEWYHADAHTMSEILPHDSYDLVIANSVFEHFHQPFKVMGEVYKVLKPGGRLFWHTPFNYEHHGVPFDFFRYTTAGAKAVATSAGLEVDFVRADGGFDTVISNLLGIGSRFWQGRLRQLHARETNGTDDDTRAHPFYLSTAMMARKP